MPIITFKWGTVIFSILLIGFIFFSAFANAQDSAFVIKGDLEKIRSGTIYLNIYQNDKTMLDSTQVIHGKFVFEGFVTDPFFASLTIPERKNDFFTFYIEPGEMLISGRGDSLKLLLVKGSEVNDDDKLLKARLSNVVQWETTNRLIYEQAYKNDNQSVLDSLEELDEDIRLAKRKVVGDFVKANSASMRGAMAIVENFAYYAEAYEVAPLFDIFSPIIKNSSKGEEIKKMVGVYASLARGKKAPEISQLTPDSVLLSLSSLKGKYVLIDFWASWCQPCRRENPNLVEAYKRFSDKEFTILGVSYDSNKEKWMSAIKDDQLNWHQVSMLRGWSSETSNTYGIRAIPSNVLVDKEGIIIARNIFGKRLLEKLEEIIK